MLLTTTHTTRATDLDDAARCLAIVQRRREGRYTSRIIATAIREAPRHLHQAVHDYAVPTELTIADRAAVCASVVEGERLSRGVEAVAGPSAEERMAALVEECAHYIRRCRTPDAEPTAADGRRARRLAEAEKQADAYSRLPARWQAGVIHALTPAIEIVSQHAKGTSAPRSVTLWPRPSLDEVLRHAARQCAHEDHRPRPHGRRSRPPAGYTPTAAFIAIAQDRALIAEEIARDLAGLAPHWQVHAMARIASGVTPWDVMGGINQVMTTHLHPAPAAFAALSAGAPSLARVS